MAAEQSFLQIYFLPAEWSELQQGNALLTICFLLIALILFLFILFSRLRDGLRFSNKRWLTKKSQHFITSYMFNEDIEHSHVEHFRKKYLVNKKQRQIFTDTLIQLRKNIVGELADRLKQLYLHMELNIHSKRKLYASSWSIIADGIKELAEMDMQQDISLIRSFINHPKRELRSVAQVAYLRLQSDTPFSFLDELQSPLLEWQQLQLANAAHRAHMHMPSFKRWLSKQETSIVIFCVRMIAVHNQHEAVPELMNLLEHPDKSVQIEAIKAIRLLEAFDAKDRLVELYDEQKITEVKLEILKALAVIADDLVPFYRKVMATSPVKRLRLAAANGIANSSGGSLDEELSQHFIEVENKLHTEAADEFKAAV